MTVNEFINYTKEHQSDFIDYCEVLIDSNGKIMMARPSHIEAMITMVLKNHPHLTRDELKEQIPIDCNVVSYLADKYRITAVWYNSIIAPLCITRYQISTLKKLQKHNLVTSSNLSIALADDYAKYKWRSKVFTL